MDDLTDTERASINWMRVLNKKGIGFLYPTVNRGIAVPGCDRLVEIGIARRVIGHGERSGYWLLRDPLQP